MPQPDYAWGTCTTCCHDVMWSGDTDMDYTIPGVLILIVKTTNASVGMIKMSQSG